MHDNDNKNVWPYIHPFTHSSPVHYSFANSVGAPRDFSCIHVIRFRWRCNEIVKHCARTNKSQSAWNGSMVVNGVAENARWTEMVMVLNVKGGGSGGSWYSYKWFLIALTFIITSEQHDLVFVCRWDAPPMNKCAQEMQTVRKRWTRSNHGRLRVPDCNANHELDNRMPDKCARLQTQCSLCIAQCP